MTIALPRRAAIPFVAQMTASECSVACLAMVLAHHGRRVSRRDVRVALGTGRDGASAHALLEAGRALGLRGRGLRVPPGKLERLSPGAVLHWDKNHFVVLERVTSRRVYILDPARGRRRFARRDPALTRALSGLALEFEADPDARSREDADATRRPRSPTRALLRAALLRPRVLLQVLASSSAVIALGVLVAVMMERLAARALTSAPGFTDLSLVIAALVIAAALAHVARSWSLEAAGRAVARGLEDALTRGLLELPWEFFRLRSTADLRARLASVARLRGDLTDALRTATTGLPMIVVYTVVLARWSAPMAVATLALAALHGLTSLAVRRGLLRVGQTRRGGASRAARLEEQVLGGIYELKAAGCEPALERRWSDARADARRDARARDRLAGAVTSALEGFAVLIPLALMAVSAQQVSVGALTLPGLVGANCLAAFVLGPVVELLETLSRAPAIASTIERLDDVLLETCSEEQASEEPRASASASATRPIALTLDAVTSPHAAGERPALSQVTARLPRARHVVIVGGAGSGRSSLAALLVGLTRPASGRVLLDGHAPRRGHAPRGVLVPPTPLLLDGDLRDNITLGAEGPLDEHELRELAALTGLDALVDGLPLGYRTAVRDGGAGLPEELRRRVVLTRALASRPRLLVLDGSTAALGGAREQALIETLLAASTSTGHGPSTIVTVSAHRQTVTRADQVIVLDDGRVVDAGAPAALARRCSLLRDLLQLPPQHHETSP